MSKIDIKPSTNSNPVGKMEGAGANFDEIYDKFGDGSDLLNTSTFSKSLMEVTDLAAAQTLLSVEANTTATGITASTTQTQGQGLLTSKYNFIATVANDNDVVTLGPATAGFKQILYNEGDNILRVYPTSGNNVTGVVDAYISLYPGEFMVFTSKDGTNINATGSRVTQKTTVLTSSTTLTEDQMFGTHFKHTTALQTITLAAAKTEMNFTGESAVAAVVTIDPDGTNIINLNGVALTGGVSIVSDGSVNCLYSANCVVDGVWDIRTKGFSEGT